jgi:hypothetical protein
MLVTVNQPMCLFFIAADVDLTIVPVEFEQAAGLGLPLVILTVCIIVLIVMIDITTHRSDLAALFRDVPRMPRTFAHNFKKFAKTTKAICLMYFSKGQKT